MSPANATTTGWLPGEPCPRRWHRAPAGPRWLWGTGGLLPGGAGTTQGQGGAGQLQPQHRTQPFCAPP